MNESNQTGRAFLEYSHVRVVKRRSIVWAALQIFIGGTISILASQIVDEVVYQLLTKRGVSSQDAARYAESVGWIIGLSLFVATLIVAIRRHNAINRERLRTAERAAMQITPSSDPDTQSTPSHPPSNR